MTRVVVQSIKNYEENEYRRFREIISAEKRERIDRYKHTEDYRRSLLGDVLSRNLLAGMTGKAAGELDICIDEMGKPYVANAKDAYFNVSHSGEYVACIISDRPCGIDIETMDKDNLDIAKRFFARSEYEYISDAPKDEIKRRFYEIWTAKEAYSKYEGKGLGIDLGSFEVVKKENHFSVLIDGAERQTVTAGDIGGGYMLSFVCEDEGEISVETEYGDLYEL